MKVISEMNYIEVLEAKKRHLPVETYLGLVIYDKDGVKIRDYVERYVYVDSVLMDTDAEGKVNVVICLSNGENITMRGLTLEDPFFKGIKSK